MNTLFGSYYGGPAFAENMLRPFKTTIYEAFSLY